MTVSLFEIIAAARAHAAPLAAESAGYLLLAVADSVTATPREVTAEDVELSADGSIRVRNSRERGVAADGAERAVRALLSSTLEVASSVGPALKRAAAKREPAGLTQLVRELEAALIPVNRSAARRALSRIHRETERARGQGKLAPLTAAPSPETSSVSVPRLPLAAVESAAPDPAAFFAEPSTSATPEPALSVPVVTVAPKPTAVVPGPVPLAPVAGSGVAPTLTLSPPVPPASLVPTPAPASLSEQDLTRPEPVVARAKERGQSTPKLGTVVTAQTLPGEEELEEPTPPLGLERGSRVVVSPSAPAPLVDPEPSAMPDVVSAMVALHTGVDADDAPTRLKDVVTAVHDVPVIHDLTPEPELVEDAWLTQSSLDGVETSVRPFHSELAEPAVHEALTWAPGPVAPTGREPFPPSLLIGAPCPDPSPYAPAVLPTRQSDVSELLDSFHVSGVSEERELREGLKQIAGLELTPMPVPLVEEG